MVAAADAAADLGQAVVGQLAREVHGDLAGDGHGGPPVAGQERLSFDPELLGGGVEDLGDAAGVLAPAARRAGRSTWRTSAGVGGSPRSEA